MTALDMEAPFDIVMLDLSAPGQMGGKDTIEKLAAMDPAVRAVLVSVYPRDPAMTEFRKYGFKAALAKAFSVQELNMTMELVMGAKPGRVHGAQVASAWPISIVASRTGAGCRWTSLWASRAG